MQQALRTTPATRILSARDARSQPPPPRIQIENPQPVVDGGRYPRQAHRRRHRRGLRRHLPRRPRDPARGRPLPRRRRAQLARAPSCTASTRTSTATAGRGASPSTRRGRWECTIEAWTDAFATWRDELERKVDAGQDDLAGELTEGVAAARGGGGARQGRRPQADRARAARAARRRDPRGGQARRRARAPSSSPAVERHPERHGATRLEPAARARGRPRARPLRRLVRAVPALVGRAAGRRGAAAAARRARLRRPLPAADPPDRRTRTARAATTRSSPAPTTPARRGRSAPQSGGHDAVHPELGTIEDVRALCAAAREHGMDVALDFAIQCSADHPWLTEHPEWFNRRPDGTLKYAENPPKKYQDIYNVNWDSRGLARRCGRRWRRIVLYWVDAGVKVFRVDNPHTKPIAVLGVADRRGPQGRPRRDLPRRGVHAPGDDAPAGQARLHPGLHVLHVEERALGADEYVDELAWGPESEYFRPNFFPNTPDILARVPRARRARRRSTRASCSRRR